MTNCDKPLARTSTRKPQDVSFVWRGIGLSLLRLREMVGLFTPCGSVTRYGDKTQKSRTAEKSRASCQFGNRAGTVTGNVYLVPGMTHPCLLCSFFFFFLVDVIFLFRLMVLRSFSFCCCCCCCCMCFVAYFVLSVCCLFPLRY